MDSVKEKLVELQLQADIADNVSENTTQHREFTADFMMANGVTVQELDGCEYCKEDGEGYRKMFGAFSITNPFHGNEWFINTRHCKPRKICFCPMCGRRLPQPPEGE